MFKLQRGKTWYVLFRSGASGGIPMCNDKMFGGNLVRIFGLEQESNAYL